MANNAPMRVYGLVVEVKANNMLVQLSQSMFDSMAPPLVHAVVPEAHKADIRVGSWIWVVGHPDNSSKFEFESVIPEVSYPLVTFVNENQITIKTPIKLDGGLLTVISPFFGRMNNQLRLKPDETYIAYATMTPPTQRRKLFHQYRWTVTDIESKNGEKFEKMEIPVELILKALASLMADGEYRSSLSPLLPKTHAFGSVGADFGTLHALSTEAKELGLPRKPYPLTPSSL